MGQGDAFSWIGLILLGGMAGATGQSLRLIVGIKKLNDTANATNQHLAGLLLSSRVILSLLIGCIAVALAAIGGVADPRHVAAEQVLALAAAGYAGADFIEGVLARFTTPTARQSDRGARG